MLMSFMKAFSTDELGKDLNNLDLYSDNLPTQQSLGLSWDLHSDKFIYRLNDNENQLPAEVSYRL